MWANVLASFSVGRSRVSGSAAEVQANVISTASALLVCQDASPLDSQLQEKWDPCIEPQANLVILYGKSPVVIKCLSQLNSFSQMVSFRLLDIFSEQKKEAWPALDFSDRRVLNKC